MMCQFVGPYQRHLVVISEAPLKLLALRSLAVLAQGTLAVRDPIPAVSAIHQHRLSVREFDVVAVQIGHYQAVNLLGRKL